MDMDTIDTILQLLITDKAYYLKKRQDCLEYLEVFLYAIFERDFELPIADEQTRSTYDEQVREQVDLSRGKEKPGGEVWVWW